MLDWLEPIPGDSLAGIALRTWVPLLVTLFVGGALTNLLYPRLQARHQKLKAASERRVRTAEEISRAFSAYLVWARRLRRFAEWEQRQIAEGREIDSEAFNLKMSYVEGRDTARADLLAQLAVGRLYFTDATLDVVKRFETWDFENVDKTLSEQPEFAAWFGAWKDWEGRLHAAIRDDLD